VSLVCIRESGGGGGEKIPHMGNLRWGERLRGRNGASFMKIGGT